MGGAGGSASTGEPEACAPAATPYGIDASAGHSFPDVEVVDCAGNDVTLDTIRCGARVTLISIGAGWCAPCQEETPSLQAASEELADEEIRIVQLMFEDGGSAPATTSFCQSWVEMFHLTLPVLVDPAQNSLAYIDGAVAPVNVAVAEDGKVLWSLVGQIPEDIVGLLRDLEASL